MPRRRTLVAAIAVAVFLIAPAALAKGPTGATIEGEGVTGALVIDEPAELGQGTPMSELVEAAGFFPLVLAHGSAASEPPTTALGRPLVITWRMGDGVVVEEIYLHASGGPVAHVEPGQLMWDGTAASGGGWLRITSAIVAPLIELGVDEAALAHLRPDPPQATAPSTDHATVPPSGTPASDPAPDRAIGTAATADPSPTAASRSVALGLLAAVALGGSIGVVARRNRRRPRTH